MTVYRTYWKIILKNIGGIILFVGIPIIVVILFFGTSGAADGTAYSSKKLPIAVINEDGNQVILNGLLKSLEPYVEYVEIENEQNQIQDALFFRDVSYILKIPKGFAQGIYEGQESKLGKISVDGSYYSVQIDQIIQQYLDTWRTYQEQMPNLELEEILEYVNRDLSESVQVDMVTDTSLLETNDRISTYFNLLAYSSIGSLILGIGVTMGAFRKSEIRRRMLCSPLTTAGLYRKLFVCNFIFAFFIWLIGVVTGFVVIGKPMFSTLAFYLMVNYFIFIICSMSIGILVSYLVKSPKALTPIANTMSLCMSFISGVFVPQSLLSTQTNNIGSFTPMYWYVKANNTLSTYTTITWESIESIGYNLLIIISFAAACLAVALAVSRLKETEEKE